jgi:hypothetical protein
MVAVVSTAISVTSASPGWAQQSRWTVDDVLGTYERLPVENEYHTGRISQTANGSLKWTNNAGVSWSLRPDLAAGKLKIGRDNPYADQGFVDFTLRFGGDGAVTGFLFQEELYVRKGGPKKPTPGDSLERVLGRYALEKVENDWQAGTISRGPNGQLLWTNQAGIRWSLRPDLENRKLRTGADNPYADQGIADFALQMGAGGTVTGFVFNGELYRHQDAPRGSDPPGEKMKDDRVTSGSGGRGTGGAGGSRHPLLDAGGYPKDGMLHTGDISFPPETKHHDSFGWTIKNDRDFDKFFRLNNPSTPTLREFRKQIREATVLLPNASNKVQGNWKLIARQNNPRSARKSLSYSYGNSVEVSLEMSHEISAGLGVSATGGFKPFGVGAEVTVEASIGYAFTVATGEAKGQEWQATFEVEPGQLMQVWQRTINVETTLDTRTMFELARPGSRTSTDLALPAAWMSPEVRGEDIFLVTMAESYGNILWPEDYNRMRALALVRGGNRYARLKYALESSPMPGHGNRWNYLKHLFDYEGFKQIGYRRLEYQLPAKEFYATYSQSPS